jgi:5-methyltetrahydropteroyltriglutamate--homocysteine methyltransferase
VITSHTLMAADRQLCLLRDHNGRSAMRRSEDRILTTHVGSLPRSAQLLNLLLREDRGEPLDGETSDQLIADAVADVVARQLQAGVDIPSDGEQSKIGYATYTRHRLTGFEGAGVDPRLPPADISAVPDFHRQLTESGWAPRYFRPACRGPVAVKDDTRVRADISRLSAALGRSGAEAFLNAASPGTIASFQPNEYYPTEQDYLEALSEAMSAEYEAIAGAGLLLQVDCPDFAMERHITFREQSDEEFVKGVEGRVEVLNHALANVPAESTRMHVCWGNYQGPHLFDIPLTKIIRAVLRAKPTALLIEAANPRHEHEWAVWAEVPFPDEKILVPGVIDTTTNFVEHPELVAERLCRFGRIIGRERLIAGTDCGFGTIADLTMVHPSVCWLKLKALADGAQIATERLW